MFLKGIFHGGQFTYYHVCHDLILRKFGYFQSSMDFPIGLHILIQGVKKILLAKVCPIDKSGVQLPPPSELRRTRSEDRLEFCARARQGRSRAGLRQSSSSSTFLIMIIMTSIFNSIMILGNTSTPLQVTPKFSVNQIPFNHRRLRHQDGQHMLPVRILPAFNVLEQFWPSQLVSKIHSQEFLNQLEA